MRPLAERFWAKVDRRGPDECWPWTASKSATGYGHFAWKENGKSTDRKAHRLAWELTHGPIQQGDGYHGVCVCHRCDVKLCCNPDHLFLGSHRANMADRDNKGRTASGELSGPKAHRHKYQGANNGAAKLTLEQAGLIRWNASLGARKPALARCFGVGQRTVYRIVSGEGWVYQCQ